MSIRLASLILPVYNQADHIGKALLEYLGVLGGLDFPCELIPVINGRRHDRSLEICQDLAEKYPEVRPLCIEAGGWGRAVRIGLAAARGDLLCYTNSARTSGTDLLQMLHYGSIHTDMIVKASRKGRESVLKQFGSLLYNLECRMLFDLACWDVNGTPKVFSRDHHARLLGLRSDDDLIDLEFHAICRIEGYPLLEVPIVSTSRRAGKSTTNLKSALRMYVGALGLRREIGRL